MTSSNPSHAEEMAHRLSVEIFGENMPRSNPLNPYYQQNPYLPHPYYQQIPSQQYYPSQLHVDPNYNPQITSFSAGQCSTSFPSSSNQYPPSSQYNTDTATSGGFPPLHPTKAGCSTPTPDSSVPESPIESRADKRRKRAPPTYDAPWWRYYKQILGPDGVLINARCKVSNYKTSYNYVIKNGLSQFKKYADKHIAKNEEPQERLDIRMVQSCLNSDATRTLVKYDEKRMLNVFARYIAKKEQPISMTYCTDFTRLVIRGCGQPLYKRFHHNKMVSELKK
jgi:hypothetical protein